MAELGRERSSRGEIYEKNIKKRNLELDIGGWRSRIDIVALAVLLMRAGVAVCDLRDFAAIAQEAGGIGDAKVWAGFR